MKKSALPNLFREAFVQTRNMSAPQGGYAAAAAMQPRPQAPQGSAPMHPGAAMAQQNAMHVAGHQGGDWKQNLNLPAKDARLKTTVRARPPETLHLPPDHRSTGPRASQPSMFCEGRGFFRKLWGNWLLTCR